MNDTSQGTEQKLHEMFQKKTGEERLKMGCSMYDFSKQLVIDSLLNENPALSAKELSREIFIRFYGNEFNVDQRRKIADYLTGDR